MSFATDMQAVASELLTEFGQSVSVSRTSGTFTPSTGAVGSTTTTTYSGVGYPSAYNRQDIDGSLIRQDDTLLIFYCASVPQVNDIFTIGTKAMTALNIQIVTVSGSDVIYKIQLRQ
jgi:hypothetical protein